MRWWQRLRSRLERDDSDAIAALDQRKKLAQAQRDTDWILDVAAPQLARLPQDQFVNRVRDAMTLARQPRGET